MSKKRKKTESIVLVLATVVSVLAAAVLFLRYTQTGKHLTAKAAAHYLHGSVEYVPGRTGKKESLEEFLNRLNAEKNVADADESEDGRTKDSEGAEEIMPDRSMTDLAKEEGIYHILLLGEEAIHSVSGSGRTDAMLLVTIHTGQKKCHLTSILRDIYAEPDGMKPCKLNAVYAKQGAEGLYHFLYETLGIWPDGYAKVGFESFEELIDLLGGAEVTLTAEEANYLNTHNYISKEQYRTVKAGTQVLNGNQVLGYCRVRHVANCNGTRYDYGRTERQRMVLSDLFRRYREAGVMKWVSILKKALGSIETDLDEKTMEELIFAMDEYHIRETVQHQIPAAGTFTSVTEKNGVTSTLVTDWNENRKLFRSYMEENNK